MTFGKICCFLGCVLWQKFAEVMFYSLEDGGIRFLRNIGKKFETNIRLLWLIRNPKTWEVFFLYEAYRINCSYLIFILVFNEDLNVFWLSLIRLWRNNRWERLLKRVRDFNSKGLCVRLSITILNMVRISIA